MNTPATPSPPPTPRVSGVTRLLRALIVALVLVIGVLLTSTRGLGLLLHATLPALEYSALEGNLLQGATLHGVHFASPSLDVSARRVALAWRLSWRTGLLLRDVQAQDLVVELKADDNAGTASWPALPLPVTVEPLHVAGLTIVRGAQRLQFVELTAALELSQRAWSLRTFELRGDGQQVQGHARYAQGVLDAAFAAEAMLATDKARLEVNLRGALDALGVEVQLQAPWLATLRGELNARATPPRFKGAFNAAPPTVGAFSGELDGGLEQLRLQLLLPLAGAAPALRDVQLDMHLAREPLGVGGALQWRLGAGQGLQGDGRVHLDAAGLELALDSAAPPASARARLLFDAAGARLGARLRWQDVALPGTVPGVLTRGAVKLRGTLAQLFVNGALRMSDSGAGPIKAALRGELTPHAFELAQLRAELLDGSLTARGTLAWQSELCARLVFNFNALDFAHFDAAFASRLEGLGRAHGCRDGADWQGGLALEHLAGRWRGQALSARGEFERDQAASALRKWHVQLGSNVLDADVELVPSLRGRFTLAAPDLAMAWPGLAGRIAAHGEVGGTLLAPRVQARMDGAELGFEAWRARILSADIDVDAARVQASSLNLELGHLMHGDSALGTLQLHGQGSAAGHVLTLGLQGEAIHGRVQAQGQWSAPRWAGTLTAFALDDSRLGHWQLQDAAALVLEPTGITLGQACLKERNAKLCLSVPGWNAQAGAAELHLSGLSLALAHAWLPASLSPRGSLRADATLRHQAGLWQGEGQAQIAHGSVRYRAPGHDVEDLPLRDAQARFHLDSEGLRAEAGLSIGQWLRLRGTLAAALAAEAPLRGEISGEMPDIRWLEEFWPELAGSTGSAVLKGSLVGVRDAPQFSGELHLSDGSILLPRFGTELTRLTLEADSMTDHGLAVHGEAQLGAGTLSMRGEVQRRAADGLRAELHLRGEQLTVVRLPDIEADAAPDMTVILAPGAVQLNGRVAWSRVQIQLPTLPERAVVSSPDEVILNAGNASGTAAPRQRWFVDTLAADLDFTLGDEVTLTAAGLDARLTGAVHWDKTLGEQRGRGRGGLNIVEGHYKAYGQDLKIQRGALIFDGVIDNPDLEVRAVRPDLDVTAGVRVTGNLRVPKFALFAEPSLPDAEVLAYLVTGHALANASSGEAGVIARAALSLGADRAALVTSQLSNLFALDEFGINPGKTARASSIVAGKRLTPKLTVRSEFNPFERVWSFFLNYKLSPRWSVEAQTGAGQGADVIYSVERDRLSEPEPLMSDPAPPPPSP